jgi:hypothetical protein
MLGLKTRNNLYRIKTYWSLKTWWENNLSFIFWKNVFQGKNKLNKSRKEWVLLRPILPLFLKTIFYATVIIVIFESYKYFYPSPIKMENDSAVQLLTAVAGVSGVFLGLYFSAISSVASNLLVRATQDVRRFFLNSPVGQQYIQVVALTGILSIFYLIEASFGYTPHPFSLIFIALLTAFVVIRFWKIGADVFNSLEPSDSLPWVRETVKGYIGQNTPPGFRWSKPYMQKYNQEQVTYHVDLISNLITFGIKEIKLSDEQLITAANQLGHLLYSYTLSKPKIPTKSLWYKRRGQFQSWNLTDSSQVALALQTGTSIQPKMATDFVWFEERILNVILDIFTHLNKENKIGVFYQVNEVFVQVAGFYAKDFDEQALKLLFKKAEESGNNFYSIKTTDPNQAKYKEQLAFIDSQGRLPIEALLGLFRYLDTSSVEKILNNLNSIYWKTMDRSIYQSDLPQASLSRLEELAFELQNEREIEGKIVTTEWYIQTAYLQRYLFSIQNYFNYIKSLPKDYFKPKIEKLKQEGQVGLAVHLIQRWIEFSSKYKKLVDLFEKHIQECEKFFRIPDLPKPPFNFPAEHKNATGAEEAAKDEMVKFLPSLGSLVSSDEIPDYFGQALTIGIEGCYDACRDDKHKRLEVILPPVFDASLQAFERITKVVQEWTQIESKIIYSTEPLENLFEISGYAKLFSELYEKPEIWNIVRQYWDDYLAKVDAKVVIGYIAAVSTFRDKQFVIMPQAVLRTSWKIDFEGILRHKGFKIFPDNDSYDHINGKKKSNHPSTLIRIIAARSGLITMTSARDVFFAVYLSNHPAATGITLPDRYELKRRIQKEEGIESDDHEEENE